MTSIPAYAAPAFIEYVSEHAKQGDEEAQRLLERVKKRKGIPKPAAPGKSREERREERNERMTSIRVLVMERAKGACEACGFGRPHEAHHVIGAGARQTSESVETVIALCLSCHKRAHAGDLLTLTLIGEWARKHEYREAKDAIRKRVAKIEEARR